MKYYFPDSQDQIDPAYDFTNERSPEFRVRQRDDRYAHEVLQWPAYSGILVSKPIVDGWVNAPGKYTLAQRHRLYRLGVRGFFRLEQPRWSIATMGDCGAFTYVREDLPPYTVDEVIDFYDGCGFDYGISIDHVILGYDATETSASIGAWTARQRLTLDLAVDFLSKAKRRRTRFKPLGVAQGWSPASYAAAVVALQRMGYRYIALGGMVPLRTYQIDACLRAVAKVRRPDVQFHLLGVSRFEHIHALPDYGVASFDSTSPLRQAFKDDRDNYYTPERNYVAIRVPQVDGNPKLKALIRAGRIDQRQARKLELRCLRELGDFDLGRTTLPAVVAALRDYAVLVGADRDRSTDYAELLERAPWRDCECGICREVGIQVVVFRGAERNKRRGFHNVYVFGRRVEASMDSVPAIGGTS